MANMNNKYNSDIKDVFFQQIKNITVLEHDIPHNRDREEVSTSLPSSHFNIHKKNKELLVIFEDCGVDLVE